MPKPHALNAIKNPLFLATLDLQMMRDVEFSGDKSKAIELTTLEAQKPLFAGHEDLFNYLLAAHYFYVQKTLLAR